MNAREAEPIANAEYYPSSAMYNFIKASMATGAQAAFATACGYPARTCMSGVVNSAHLPYLQQPWATLKNASPLIYQGQGFGLNFKRGTSSLFLLTGTNALMSHYVGKESPQARSACFVASIIPGVLMALKFETPFIRKTTPPFGAPLDMPGKIASPNYFTLRLAAAYIGRESLFVATVLSESMGVLSATSLGTSLLQRVILLEATRDKHKIPLKPQRGQGVLGALNAAATVCPPNMVLWRFAYMGSLLAANTLWAKVSSLGLFGRAENLDGVTEPEASATVPRPAKK